MSKETLSEFLVYVQLKVVIYVCNLSQATKNLFLSPTDSINGPLGSRIGSIAKDLTSRLIAATCYDADWFGRR